FIRHTELPAVRVGRTLNARYPPPSIAVTALDNQIAVVRFDVGAERVVDGDWLPNRETRPVEIFDHDFAASRRAAAPLRDCATRNQLRRHHARSVEENILIVCLGWHEPNNAVLQDPLAAG